MAPTHIDQYTSYHFSATPIEICRFPLCSIGCCGCSGLAEQERSRSGDVEAVKSYLGLPGGHGNPLGACGSVKSCSKFWAASSRRCTLLPVVVAQSCRADDGYFWFEAAVTLCCMSKAGLGSDPAYSSKLVRPRISEDENSPICS